ncbi:MAG: glycosyltransferase family 9 protein [Spartobacteria bacterium]|nr:glycosyltransferase family 9 protein [Spartobacteria bacterium]
MKWANQPRRILIVKLSSLGDLFHALPVVHLLKHATGASVDWVVQSEYVSLVQTFDDVDHVIGFPRKKIREQGRAFVRQLRSSEYDLVIDLQGLLKSALITRLARAAWRLGPSYQREGATFFYHHVVGPRNKDRHAVEEALDVIRFLELPDSPRSFPVTFPEVTLPDTDARSVAMIPCSRWTTKNWPIEHFSVLACRLHDQLGLRVILAGAPDDRDTCDAIAQKSGVDVLNWAGKTSIPQLGGLLSQMDLVISVDSGPMHMACAAGVPVVAIFGPTSARRTGPYSAGAATKVMLAEPRLSCQPCMSRTCANAIENACLRKLDPDTVFEMAAHML